MRLDFYYSKKDNKLIEVLNGDENTELIYFNEKMDKILPNTVDAAKEKHVPVATIKDDNTVFVQVGSVEHPMEESHLIDCIYVVTDKGDLYKKILKYGEKPELIFNIGDAKKIDIYASCNLHGVWKSSLII